MIPLLNFQAWSRFFALLQSSLKQSLWELIPRSCNGMLPARVQTMWCFGNWGIIVSDITHRFSEIRNTGNVLSDSRASSSRSDTSDKWRAGCSNLCLLPRTLHGQSDRRASTIGRDHTDRTTASISFRLPDSARRAIRDRVRNIEIQEETQTSRIIVT